MSMKPSPETSRHINRYALYVSLLLIGSLLFRFFHTLAKAIFVQPNSYQFTEFLINYEGGFVRRGLLGELLLWFCSLTALSPFTIISVISLAAWGGFILYFFRKFKKADYCWWLLASPLFWGPPGSVIRKDYLCYLIIIAMMYIIRNHHQLSIPRFLAVCGLTTLGMFLHEAFVFYGPTVICLILIADSSTRVKGIILTGLSVCVFLLFTYFKGTPDTPSQIIHSWNTLLGHDILTLSPNSIEALGRDSMAQFKFHIIHNLHEYGGSFFGWSGIIIRPLFAVLAYYFIINFIFVFRHFSPREEARMRTNLSIIYIFSFICMLPMFVFLSCDYGRLYQYVVVATLSAFIIFSPAALASIFPKSWYIAVNHLNLKINHFLPPSKGLMVVILVLLAPTPSCFAPGLAFNSSVIGNYCSVIDMIMHRLLPGVI